MPTLAVTTSLIKNRTQADILDLLQQNRQAYLDVPTGDPNRKQKRKVYKQNRNALLEQYLEIQDLRFTALEAKIADSGIIDTLQADAIAVHQETESITGLTNKLENIAGTLDQITGIVATLKGLAGL